MSHKISNLIATSVVASFIFQLLLAVVVVSLFDAIFTANSDPMLIPLIAMFSTWAVFKQKELDEKNRQ